MDHTLRHLENLFEAEPTLTNAERVFQYKRRIQDPYFITAPAVLAEVEIDFTTVGDTKVIEVPEGLRLVVTGLVFTKLQIASHTTNPEVSMGTDAGRDNLMCLQMLMLADDCILPATGATHFPRSGETLYFHVGVSAAATELKIHLHLIGYFTADD